MTNESVRALAIRLISTLVLLAWSAVGFAGEDANRLVIRRGASELRLLNRFEPGKVPIVFIHGLLGSPANWSSMIGSLSGDPAIRARAQFVTFRYDSLRSVPESGLELAESLAEAMRRFDRAAPAPVFQRTVLVGHSLGGLVAKAAAGVFGRRRVEWLQTDGDEEGSARVPRVERFIFIATPHRGAPIDQGAIRSLGSWLARSRSSAAPSRDGQSSSIDQLSWRHPLLLELEQARASGGIPFHSIVATLGDASGDGATDGIVPVASARLDGASSELVVRAPHACFQHADVIGEVGRIIIQHSGPRAGTLPLRMVVRR